VERGMAGSGKEKQIFYIGNSLVPVIPTETKEWVFSPGW
jgi:hypothetical protein